MMDLGACLIQQFDVLHDFFFLLSLSKALDCVCFPGKFQGKKIGMKNIEEKKGKKNL